MLHCHTVLYDVTKCEYTESCCISLPHCRSYRYNCVVCVPALRVSCIISGWCRPLAENTAVVPVDYISLDITGGKSEYDILASQGPGTTLRKVLTWKCSAPPVCCACAGVAHQVMR